MYWRYASASAFVGSSLHTDSHTHSERRYASQPSPGSSTQLLLPSFGSFRSMARLKGTYTEAPSSKPPVLGTSKNTGCGDQSAITPVTRNRRPSRFTCLPTLWPPLNSLSLSDLVITATL